MQSKILSTKIPGDNFDITYIRKVYVPQHRRGKGVARKMLEKFLEKRRSHYILLEAHPFDTGGPDARALKRFYRSLGFRCLLGSHLNLMIRVPQC